MAPPQPPTLLARPYHVVGNQTDEWLQLAVIEGLDRRLQSLDVSLIHLMIIALRVSLVNRPGTAEVPCAVSPVTLLPLPTDRDDLAVVEPVTLIAPCVVAFPGAGSVWVRPVAE